MSEKPIERLNLPNNIEGMQVYRWGGLVNGDTGEPLILPQHSDKTIQVLGAWGAGGSISIEGSCMIVGPTWLVLTDPQGNTLTKTANAIETILENPYQVRPHVTAGDGTTKIDIYIVVNKG